MKRVLQYPLKCFTIKIVFPEAMTLCDHGPVPKLRNGNSNHHSNLLWWFFLPSRMIFVRVLPV